MMSIKTKIDYSVYKNPIPVTIMSGIGWFFIVADCLNSAELLFSFRGEEYKNHNNQAIALLLFPLHNRNIP